MLINERSPDTPDTPDAGQQIADTSSAVASLLIGPLRLKVLANYASNVADFEIGQGASSPTLRLQLLDGEGMGVDLTGWTALSVRARLYNALAGVSVFSMPLVTDDAQYGEVSRAFAAQDTQTPGFYALQVVGTDAAGNVTVFPSGNDYPVLLVGASL